MTATPEALLAAETVPHVAAVHPVPDSAQLTPSFALSFATVAVNACICPVCTDAVVGATVTDIAGAGGGVGVDGAAVIVITAPAVLVPSATEVAVSATLAGLGTAAGAV